MQRSAKQSALNGKYRVAHNPAGREWFIAVLPDMTEAELREKQKSALKTATASSLKQKYDELSAQAASLEADAEKLETKARKIRKQANALKQDINNEVGKIIGPVSIATWLYRIACNEATDAEIAALDTKRRAQYLLDSKNIAPMFTTWGIPDWLRGSEPDDLFDPPDWMKTKAEAVAGLSASAAATAAEQRLPDDGLDIPESLRRVAP
jgi:outer membrane murein-binding lipoprotein Lpp